MTESHAIPKGLCQCGCGGRTSLVPATVKSRGLVKGEPHRFLFNHHKTRPGVPAYLETTEGCWIWQRRTSKGYGRLVLNGRSVLAHRLYYERRYGPVPEGLELDHLCRTKACVNPDHLEAVTSAENSRRGRATKLTAEHVDWLRKVYRGWHGPRGRFSSAASKALPVTQRQINFILSGRSWKPAADDVLVRM